MGQAPSDCDPEREDTPPPRRTLVIRVQFEGARLVFEDSLGDMDCPFCGEEVGEYEFCRNGTFSHNDDPCPSPDDYVKYKAPAKIVQAIYDAALEHTEKHGGEMKYSSFGALYSGISVDIAAMEQAAEARAKEDAERRAKFFELFEFPKEK